MGCGSSMYPVATKEVREGEPSKTSNLEEGGQEQEKCVSNQTQEKLEVNETLNKTEKSKLAGERTEKEKVNATGDVSSRIQVNSTGQTFANQTDVQAQTEYRTQKTAISPSQGDKTYIISKRPVEADKEITTPTEATDTVSILCESRSLDLVSERDVNTSGTNVEKANIQDETEIAIQELGEKESCSNNDNPLEMDIQINKEIASVTESSNPTSSLDNELTTSRDKLVDDVSDGWDSPSYVNSCQGLKQDEILAAQDHKQDLQSNCLTNLQAVNEQSGGCLDQGKVQDAGIVLEHSSNKNVPKKESGRSIHDHESTPESTENWTCNQLPESEPKLSDETVVESSLITDLIKNSESEANSSVLEQEAGASIEEEQSIAISYCGEDQEKEEANPLLLAEDSSANVLTVQNNKTAVLDSNANFSYGEKILSSRDIDAENRLTAALRLTCELYPGHLVRDLDTKGVMALHLMRSLSPGVITVAELVQKLANLTELDLSGNLLGPQGFRVICLSLTRNMTLKVLNLANNLADTDSSECIGMMLSSNCCLENLDVSGNNLGNDYFSRCVGPALMTNKSLRVLTFSSCGSTDASAICEAMIEGTSRLEGLDASNNHLGAVFGDGISRVLQKPSYCLRRLDVHGTYLRKEGMAALLAGIQHNTSLISLNAAGHEVSSLSFLMDFLYSCICHPTLEELILEGSKVLECDEWEPPDVPLAEGKSSLNRLLLSGCSLTNKALQILASKIPGKLNRLSYLDVSNNDQLTTESLSYVAATLSSPDQTCLLSVLDFSLNASDGIAEDMEKLPELKELKTLLLKKCRITSPSVVDLSKLMTIATSDSLQITSLTLDGVKLSGTDALKGMLGLSDMSIPTNLCCLELLSLTGCGLNDRDVKPVMTAIGNGLVIKQLRLSANRLTDTVVNYLVDSPASSLSLQSLDLSINKIRNGGAEKLAGAISDKLTNLQSLSLADNCIGKAGILALVGKVGPASHLEVLNLKGQQQPLGEEDVDQIIERLANSLGFDLESNGGHAPSCFNLTSNLSINMTGLGGEPGELGPKLDSLAVLTDYSSKHRRTLTLEDALQLSAVLSHSGNTRAQMSQRDWNLVISADKDAPAWLQLGSQRESAIYVSNLPLSVTAEKLEGLLDSEAECNVKEVYLLKDQILRKPNGLAWVLFTDTASVQRAVEYYNSGQAVMYGTPFVISSLNVDVISDPGIEENAEARAREEMIQRAEDRKAGQTAHAQLVQSNYEQSLARHEYAAQHPAYADGRVW